MTVLERPGEERPRRRDRLEGCAVRAEPDDDEAGIDTVHRLEQHLHPFLLDQLAETTTVGSSPARNASRRAALS